MKLEKLSIAGAHLATHKVFPDERGFFREWFKYDEILAVDTAFSVQQANYSKSRQWVIRGIHYSLAPDGQAKVVTCVGGAIVDVIVDLRIGSPTYLQIEHIELSEESGNAIYIPSGVGHGFAVKSDFASVVYLTSSGYEPAFEKAISPTDPDLGIAWPLPLGVIPIISKQDCAAPMLSSAYENDQLPRF
jgi:dTDP-4-dehydrorhamnose 3,5-epimerase